MQNKWRPFHTRALSGQIPFMGVLLQNGVEIDAIDKVIYFSLNYIESTSNSRKIGKS